jgi:hypothetical protein
LNRIFDVFGVKSRVQTQGNNLVGMKVILQAMVKLGSHRNDEISGTSEAQLQFGALLGSLASVIGPVEFVPLDLVGRHVYEVQSFS